MKSWSALAALVATSACTPSTMYFATYTKVGISAEANATTGTPTALEMGYNRFEGILVPLEEESVEAPSAFACIDLENKWFGGLKIQQTFATGAAAEKAAQEQAQGCAAKMGTL